MAADVVLQTWKEISEYVGRTERTLQRWEQQFGFPIRRPSGKSRSSVMALTQEIHEWTRERPSLLQIRCAARLDRTKLIANAPGQHNLARPRSQNSSGHSIPESANHGNQRGVSFESPFLDHSALLQEQKILREDLATTRQEHKILLWKLCQTLQR